MNRSLLRSLIAVVVCVSALAGLSASATAATTIRKCEPVFAGSAKAQAARCAPTSRSNRGPRGIRGARGLRGLVGAAGAMGATGIQGSQGLTGDVGAAGSAGLQGVPGIAGVVGAAGSQGATGLMGAAGALGATGAVGLTGATGATGLAGVDTSTEYAYVYNLTPQVVAIGASIPLDSNGIMTAGITHFPGSDAVVLTVAGDYKVTFSVSSSEPSQIGVFVNGVLVPGTIYGSGAGTQQNTGYVIVRVGAGDVLQLRNYQSSAAITLASMIGGTEANVNASISIEQLG